MNTRRHKTPGSGPSVPALIAWTGSGRARSGDPDPVAMPTFSAAALTGTVASRAGAAHHAAHRSALFSAVGAVSPLIRATRARHVTAGLVLVCGSVLSAAVTTTDGTTGPQPGTALPEVAPGVPAPAALPGARVAAVETAAASTRVSGPEAAPGRPSPEPAGLGGAQAAPPAPAGAGGSAPSGGAGTGRSGPTSTAPEPRAADTDPAPPPSGSDEAPSSPIEQVTEPVKEVTEPVTGTVERTAEPVGDVVEDAGQPAMSMLDQPLL
jgi:hypothetical protein